MSELSLKLVFALWLYTLGDVSALLSYSMTNPRSQRIHEPRMMNGETKNYEQKNSLESKLPFYGGSEHPPIPQNQVEANYDGSRNKYGLNFMAKPPELTRKPIYADFEEMSKLPDSYGPPQFSLPLKQFPPSAEFNKLRDEYAPDSITGPTELSSSAQDESEESQKSSLGNDNKDEPGISDLSMNDSKESKYNEFRKDYDSNSFSKPPAFLRVSRGNAEERRKPSIEYNYIDKPRYDDFLMGNPKESKYNVFRKDYEPNDIFEPPGSRIESDEIRKPLVEYDYKDGIKYIERLRQKPVKSEYDESREKYRSYIFVDLPESMRRPNKSEKLRNLQQRLRLLEFGDSPDSSMLSRMGFLPSRKTRVYNVSSWRYRLIPRTLEWDS